MSNNELGDTWKDLQAFKSRQNSLRERLQRRKKEREEIVQGIAIGVPSSALNSESTPAVETTPALPVLSITGVHDEKLERQLLLCLLDVALRLPIEGKQIASTMAKALNVPSVSLTVVDSFLRKFATQQLIVIKESAGAIQVLSTEHSKLHAFSAELCNYSKRKEDSKNGSSGEHVDGDEPETKVAKRLTEDDGLESLLSLSSTKERANKQVGEEILHLLSQPTAKERSLVARFRSQGGAQVQAFCRHGTSDECQRAQNADQPCDKLHFKKILQKHTDESLGDCSFLNTCFHMDTCKYVHYEVDYSTMQSTPTTASTNIQMADCTIAPARQTSVLQPSQWIQCDLRFFDMTVLGKFSVVMADPPWDIHMELPYGTMSDDEMRALNIPCLQDDGLIFLWVTGRAMELGRECLKLWGYDRCDELIWVKTNQLQRIIRTGRTGHWLNHGKEHCLVGIKGQPTEINRGLDCDVLVAEVRATSHKPDEIYGIIERLSPGTRKIELFGRPHNVQPNWITLGNQVDGVRLTDSLLIENFNKRYPDGNCLKKPI